MNEIKTKSVYSNAVANEFNKVKENNITTKFTFNFFDENLDSIDNNNNNQKDKKKKKKKKKKKSNNNNSAVEEDEDEDEGEDNNNNNNNIELTDVKNDVEKLLIDTTNNIENLTIIDTDKSLKIKVANLETETKSKKNKPKKKKKGNVQVVETTNDEDDDFASLIASFTKADQIVLENDQTLKQSKEQIIKPSPNSKFFFKSHKDPELDHSEKMKAKFGDGKNLTAIGPAKVRDPNWNNYTSPFSFGFGF